MPLVYTAEIDIMRTKTPSRCYERRASYAIAVATLAIAHATHGALPATLLNMPRDYVAKPKTNLRDFYEFYLGEHRNPTCRVLHVTGTSMVALSLFTKYRYLFAPLVTGISCGLMLSEFLSPLSNGLLEFASIIIISYLIVKGTTDKAFPWHVLVMGYGPAWIGHFFFEDNRPATFKYPTYSLLSDFIMWYQSLTGQLSLKEELFIPLKD